MSEDQAPAEKKIIIDEDWKSQVEAEKAAAEMKEPAAMPAEEPFEPEQALPPPTLSFLANTMYLQGAIALGLLPNPVSDKPPTVKVEYARHAIDMLAMLQQKTEGNRTPEESDDLENILHQLRMAFVAVTHK